MNIKLSGEEARVLGVLIEKERTTPDYYPMSLAGITAGCNQKSNREPVMSLGESQVQQALDGLVRHRLVWEKTPSGSRVTKYAHRLANTLGLNFDFTTEEVALLCVLMLRGAQTLGELRTRAARLHAFADMNEVEHALTRLMERSDGPYVVRLARQPGRKESRFAHLLCGEVQPDELGLPVGVPPALSSSNVEERLDALEEALLQLRAQIDILTSRWGS